MKRLIEKTVFCGLVTACLVAIWPTSRSPSLVKPTTDGVVRPPSAVGMTTGSPPSITATTELVVPRSMPTILDFAAMDILLVSNSGQTFKGYFEPTSCLFLCHFDHGGSQDAVAKHVPFLQFAGNGALFCLVGLFVNH